MTWLGNGYMYGYALKIKVGISSIPAYSSLLSLGRMEYFWEKVTEGVLPEQSAARHHEAQTDQTLSWISAIDKGMRNNRRAFGA